jgi:ABC-type multidrug transport system fused ATPase/permease subunit
MTPINILRPERLSLAAIVILTAISTLSEAGFLVLVTRLGLSLGGESDAIPLVGGAELHIDSALMLAAGCVLVRFASSLVSSWLTSRALARSAVRMRKELVVAWLDTSWAHKVTLARGRVQQLLSNYTQTAATVVTALARGVVATVSLAALLILAFVTEPALTVLAVLVIGTLGLAMVPLRRTIRKHTVAASEAQLHYAAVVYETETVALEIQVHGVHDAAAKRVVDAASRAAHTLRSSHFLQAAVSPSYQSIAYLSLVVLLVIGRQAGVQDVATLGAVLLLLLRSLSYGQSLQVARAQYVGARVYLDSLADELQGFHESTAATGSEDGSPTVEIVSDGLTFSYDDDGPALRGINFTFEPGETVGIVGPSGSGKSTLVELLLGLRDSNGALRLGELELDSVNRAWWSHQVALVPQDNELLTGTVADNVRFFRPEITDEQIVQACRAAALDAEIDSMPHGYDTHLGERGSRLSGGQRQRLCIARALAGSPSILVLDEPTSALDERSEAAVLRSLDALAGVTTVIVTHRPAALDICDRVLELDAGQIASIDTRERSSTGLNR